MKLVKQDDFRLKLRGNTAVFVDWANVYGWRSSLKKEVDPKKLFKYLKSYPGIKEINIYSGTDKHPKSKQSLKYLKGLGFNVVTKEVKFVPVSLDSSHFKELAHEIKASLKSIDSLKSGDIEKILKILSRKVMRRKCDFDVEIALDCFESLGQYEGYIFFSGDGDFTTLYTRLIGIRKQVIVVYAPGYIGREIWEIQKGIFKVSVQNLGL